jgi:hypothetical protein
MKSLLFLSIQDFVKGFKLKKAFPLVKSQKSMSIDHWRLDELGSGPNWKIARFKKHKSSSIVFQNDLAFLGRIGKEVYPSFPRSMAWEESEMEYKRES